jgi:hypothetical protein
MNTQTPKNREMSTFGWARDLCHPVPLGAVFVMAVNDHWLKWAGVVPEVVTGKLSDLVGVFYFPLLLVAVVQGLGWLVLRRRLEHRRVLVWSSVLATGVGFAAVKLWAPINAAVADVWGVMVMDATDLVVLPVLVLSLVWMHRRSNCLDTGRSEIAR